MAGSGLASSGKAGRREEKHGQPVPKVGRWGARADRDAGGGFHIAQLNPAGVTAPDFRAGWCSREHETAARWSAVDRCVAVGSHEADRSRQTRRTVSGAVPVRLQTLRPGRLDAVMPDGSRQVPDGRLILHGTCLFRMPGAAAPSVR